jgi:hypothetical protein
MTKTEFDKTMEKLVGIDSVFAYGEKYPDKFNIFADILLGYEYALVDAAIDRVRGQIIGQIIPLNILLSLKGIDFDPDGYPTTESAWEMIQEAKCCGHIDGINRCH